MPNLLAIYYSQRPYFFYNVLQQLLNIRSWPVGKMILFIIIQHQVQIDGYLLLGASQPYLGLLEALFQFCDRQVAFSDGQTVHIPASCDFDVGCPQTAAQPTIVQEVRQPLRGPLDVDGLAMVGPYGYEDFMHGVSCSRPFPTGCHDGSSRAAGAGRQSAYAVRRPCPYRSPSCDGRSSPPVAW